MREYSDEEREQIKSWANVGSPGPTQAKKYIPSEEQQKRFIHLKNPIEVPVDWHITEDKFLDLEQGHRSADMDDKWNVYMDDMRVVHFYRSWTDREVFSFLPSKVKNASGYTVTSFLIEKNDEKVDLAEYKRLLSEVLSALFGINPV